MSEYLKMRDEVVKGNKYFFKEPIHRARILFRFRADLYSSKCNCKNNPSYKKEKYMCDSCETSQDVSSHVLYCPSYSDLRVGKDLQSDEDLAIYLQKVLLIRSKLRLLR